MLKILTVCGAGVGSSMMLKVFTDQILSSEGIDAQVSATDIGSISTNGIDIIITTTDFASMLRNTDADIIRIDNLMDKVYLKEQLLLTINKIK